MNPDKKYLWKFYDLHKFIAFLQNREIFFSRLDSFEDEMEICSEELAYRIMMDYRIAESPYKNESLSKDVFDEHQRRFLIQLHSLKPIQRLFSASCFYQSDKESLAMWKLYAGEQGIAIQFNSKEFNENVIENFNIHLSSEFQLSGRKMRYVDLTTNSIYDENANIKALDNTFFPFNKDQSYEHENEYRYVLYGKGVMEDSRSVGLPIDLDEKYFNFIVSPDTEDWKIYAINKLIKANGFNKVVEKSNILTKNVIQKHKLKLFDKVFGDGITVKDAIAKII